MNSYTYYNGAFAKTDDIRIPLSDRAIYFGDGIYDAAIGKGGRIFLIDEHIKRFISNAKRLGFPHIPTYKDLSELLSDTVKRASLDEYFVYFQISRNAETRMHSALGCSTANLMITVSEFSVKNDDKPISLITYPDNPNHYCDIKTLNLLPSVLASTAASEAGCDEAVFHRGATVTECAHSNISILKSGILYTHPTSELILPGITRRHLLIACESLGIPYREHAFTVDDLYCADEVLVTSTSRLCRCATSINGRPVGGKDRQKSASLRIFLYREYENL